MFVGLSGIALVGLVGGAASGKCCEVCHKSLPTQRQYHKHVLVQHPTSGSFPCTLCNRSFTMECLLREHQTYVHGAADRHRCHGCATEFACFGTWKAHVGLCPLVINGGNGHPQPDPTPQPQYQCGVCDDRLDTMKKLFVHINLHLPKQMSDDAQPAGRQSHAQVFTPVVAATAAPATVLQQIATPTASQAAIWQATTNIQTVESAAQHSAAYIHHTGGAYLGTTLHPQGSAVTTTSSDQPIYWPAGTTVTVDSSAAGTGAATTTIPYQV